MLNVVRVVGGVLALGALAGSVASFSAGGVVGVVGGVVLLLAAAFLGYVVYLLVNPEASMERLAARRAHLDQQAGRTEDPATAAGPAVGPAPEGRLAEPQNRAQRRAVERQARRRT